MKLTILFLVFVVGCELQPIDTTPPAAPRGVQTLPLDNAVQIDWLPNTEPDLAGYNVWVSDRYNGKYIFIAKTRASFFIDHAARNGVTYYYAVSAYDYDGNESQLSSEVVRATPRPEGYNVKIFDYHRYPGSAGYDFSSYSVGRYDDKSTDVFFEFYSGRYFLDVWNDTDIQDMGYTRSLDDIAAAPTSGWSPSKSAEAIVGHTYVIWTWDDHYAKIRLTVLNADRLVFDWAYQTAKGNTALKRSLPQDGQRNLTRQDAISLKH